MAEEFKFEVTMQDGEVHRYKVFGEASRDATLRMERLVRTVKTIKINGKKVL